MLEKLRSAVEKYEQLTAQLNASETYGNPTSYGKLAREQKLLEPIVTALKKYDSLESDLSAAYDLGLSADEISEIHSQITETEREITKLLLPHDPNDERNVIMEIRAGTGGEEAALFASDLFRMYSMYADHCGWDVNVVNSNETEIGGLKEIVFTVEGTGAYSRLKYEAGAHCVKRIPETESSGRIQTSTATVAVLPEVEEPDFFIDPKELKIDTFRSSGAGGQKVNKTSSAIRVTHIPTGMVVECQDERSQYRNKDRAISILRSRLYEVEHEKHSAGIAAQRRSQVGTGERSEKIRTYFFLRSQVVDQRLNGDVRTFRLENILNGNLDEMIDRLAAEDEAEKLKANSK